MFCPPRRACWVKFLSDGPFFFNAHTAMLIKKDPDLISAYLEDYSNLKGGFCDLVAFPMEEAEIAEFLKDSSAKKSPVTISGAGTGVTGARIPFGGRVLSLEKMNKIIDIRKHESGEGEALVEPGLLLQDFLSETEKYGLFYPPDPTEKTSFIGGNVATSASGARSFKFGTTRDYVLGLKVMLSSGDSIEIDRDSIFADNTGAVELQTSSGENIKVTVPKYKMPSVKNASGYFAKKHMDAIDLFIGQEGTLGVITQIRLKLISQLKGMLDCYTFFKKGNDALLFVKKAREQSIGRGRNAKAIDAISLEYFDENALNLLREKHNNIPKDAKGAIYFEQEVDRESESDLIEKWAALITECNGLLDDTWFAQTAKERQRLQDVRHDLPDMVNEYLKKHNLIKVGTDIAVDPVNIFKMIEYYNNLLSEAGLRYLIFGHIGEAHLHVNILPKDKKQTEKAAEIYEALVKKAISLGGTPSAEHGIGKIKHKYLEMLYGADGVKTMAALKKALDPACILGLDNIFSKKTLNSLVL